MIKECGVTLGGNINFTWDTTNDINVTTNSISIRDTTNDIVLIDNQENTGAIMLNIAPHTKLIDGTIQTFVITGNNTINVQFTKTYGVTYYSPIYYGVGVSGLLSPQIQLLTKNIMAKSDIIITFSTSDQVIYFAYPKSRGILSSILDQNGIEMIQDWTIWEETFNTNIPYYNGQATLYYIYEFNNITTVSDFTITFKY
jgi:hypothetical protein